MTQALTDHAIDLVVLDLRLASEDGMQLARRLREESAMPIIIVTGKTESRPVMGLELGADDYVVKPFSPRELLARIRAVLRRYRRRAKCCRQGRQAPRLPLRRLGAQPRQPAADSPQGDRVELTHAEFNLLQAFCAAPQRVLSREQLLDLSRCTARRSTTARSTCRC